MDWYIAENDQPKYISENDLIDKIQNGDISSDTLVVNEELENWVPLDTTEIWGKYVSPDRQKESCTKTSEDSTVDIDKDIFSDSGSMKILFREKRYRIISKIGFFSGILGIWSYVSLYSIFNMLYNFHGSVAFNSRWTPNSNSCFSYMCEFFAYVKYYYDYRLNGSEYIRYYFIFICILIFCGLSLVLGIISCHNSNNSFQKNSWDNPRLLGIISICLGIVILIIIILVNTEVNSKCQYHESLMIEAENRFK